MHWDLHFNKKIKGWVFFNWIQHVTAIALYYLNLQLWLLGTWQLQGLDTCLTPPHPTVGKIPLNNNSPSFTFISTESGKGKHCPWSHRSAVCIQRTVGKGILQSTCKPQTKYCCSKLSSALALHKLNSAVSCLVCLLHYGTPSVKSTHWQDSSNYNFSLWVLWIMQWIEYSYAVSHNSKKQSIKF